MAIEIVKRSVCVDCFSEGIRYPECSCVVNRQYETVILEFELCSCCNQLLNDGEPIDSEFNHKQIKNLKR